MPAGTSALQLHVADELSVCDSVERARPAAAALADRAFSTGWVHRCHAPACTQTFSNARVCGGCRIAAYCSRRCQKRAWRAPQAAHREVCDIFRTYKHVELGTEGGDEDAVTVVVSVLEGMFPYVQLEAACANVEHLRATQFARLCEYIHLSYQRRVEIEHRTRGRPILLSGRD
jgi:hypothetical protein